LLSLKLNTDGDLEMDELNNLKMIDGIEELKQRQRLSIITRAGEWFLDTSLGIDWFNLLGNKPAEEDKIVTEIKKVLKKDAAVKRVLSASYEPAGNERTLKISYEVLLVDDSVLMQTLEV
jgi:hypothetical protein